ncbi:MAG: TIR domain-containing protein [Acidobacteriota bacterium]
MAGQKIFLSYRREDSGGYTESLYKALVERYGSEFVFYDRKQIEPGAKFPDRLRTAVAQSAIVLVVISRQWLKLRDDEGHRRLDVPGDWVAAEIELALSGRGQVIPVLVDGAQMPQAGELPAVIQSLAERQAAEVTPTRWDEDLGRLQRSIDRYLLGRRLRPPRQLAAMASAAALGFASLAWLTDLAAVPGLRGAQRLFENALGQSAPATFALGEVALVEINDREQSIADRRRAYASLLNTLAEADASVIALDAFFDWDLETEPTSADLELAEAVETARALGARIVLASKGLPPALKKDPATGRLIPPASPLPAWLREPVGDGWGYVTPQLSPLTPGGLARIELARLKHFGGRVQSGDLWPTFALRAAMQHLGATVARYDFDRGQIRLCAPIQDTAGPDAEDSVCGRGFENRSTIPVEKLSKAADDLRTGARSAERPNAVLLLIRLHLAPPEQFEDRTRRADDTEALRRAREPFPLVGSTRERPREGLGDYPGYRIHAQVAADILAQRFIRPAGAGLALPLFAGAALLGTVWRRRKRRPLEISDPSTPQKHWLWSLADMAVAGLAVTAAAYLAALLAFRGRLLILPVPYTALAFMLAYLLLAAIERRRAT